MRRGVLISSVLCLTAIAPAPRSAKSPEPTEFTSWFEARVESTLNVLADGGDAAKASRDLAALLHTGAAYAPDSELSCLTTAAAWSQLLPLLSGDKKVDHGPTIAYLRSNPALAVELGLLFAQGRDRPAVATVLAELISSAGTTVGKFPALAAAVCVVYDVPHTARSSSMEPERPVRIQPADVFEYFVANKAALAYPPESLPPQLLVYLVETTAEPSELQWALARHGGDRNVGKRYNDLVYDTGWLKHNKPKKIESLPYTLPNLKQVGGVCEEQAYYAAHVARAIGVPGVVIGGRDAEMSHVWVGFLQRLPDTLAWNMDEGRYKEYEKLRGRIQDPQLRQEISDDELSLTARLAAVPTQTRQTASAMLVASRALRGKAAPPEGGIGREEPRTDALTLVEAAHERTPDLPAVWREVARVSGSMSAAQRQAWFARTSAVAKRRLPTFAYESLAGMIDSIESPKEKIAAWEWAFKEYRGRADLAGDAKLKQAKAMLHAEDPAGAYDAVMMVIRTFPNDGTVIVDATREAERLLTKTGKQAAIPDVLGEAFRRIGRPPTNSAVAFRQSNYFQVGDAYAKALEKAGRTNEAQRVRRMIDRGVEPEK